MSASWTVLKNVSTSQPTFIRLGSEAQIHTRTITERRRSGSQLPQGPVCYIWIRCILVVNLLCAKGFTVSSFYCLSLARRNHNLNHLLYFQGLAVLSVDCGVYCWFLQAVPQISRCIEGVGTIAQYNISVSVVYSHTHTHPRSFFSAWADPNDLQLPKTTSPITLNYRIPRHIRRPNPIRHTCDWKPFVTISPD